MTDSVPSESPASHEDVPFDEAVRAIHQTLDKIRGCSAAEREALATDLRQLEDMHRKITQGRVEIVVFGEISTGKSALINALIGREVASVDVQGGWTKQVWGTTWEGSGHRIRGLDQSEVLLVDTPGINEVGGADRKELAEVTARQADLILFVVDSDINDVEFASLLELAAVNKPIILILNKRDLYSEQDLQALIERLRQRVEGLIPPQHLVTTSAHPRPIEYILELPNGRTETQWRRPEPDVGELKGLILDVLEHEGLQLIVLNAALYAADKSDRVASVRVQLRKRLADRVIAGMALTKAIAVSANPVALFDVLGGMAIDATMIVTLSKVYGLNFSLAQSRQLAKAIASAAGVFALGELTSWGASLFKAVTLSFGTVLTLLPQGAAAGFSSYIIGRAAQHYFEHGGSWGMSNAKSVVKQILAETDKNSVISHLKDELRRKLSFNRHASR
ncbi:MAG TPA: GTP-binding protein [Pirellulaceae bacterium]|nr:GTP-binding protein [Pirellulaceae bacterium]